MFLGGWAPATSPPSSRRRGNDAAAGADIVLEVHYHRNGKPEKDKTEVGVYFATGPIDKRMRLLPIIKSLLLHPAGRPDHEVTAAMPSLTTSPCWASRPHMHQIGHDMTVRATLRTRLQ